MFAESLSRLLTDEGEIAVVGTAASGSEAARLTDLLRPDVALIDVQLPDQDGVDVARMIRNDHPETRIVMLTGSTDERVMLASLDAGASAYITKDRAVTDVIDAVKLVNAGEAVVSPPMLAALLQRVSRGTAAVGSDLTDREREVLQLIRRGSTNKAIAAELYLSVHTIRNHVSTLLAKLGAHSKLQAVSIAERERIPAFPITERPTPEGTVNR